MRIRHKLIIPSAILIIGMCGVYLSMYQISVQKIAQVFELSNFMMGAIVALQFAGLCLPPLFLGTLSEKIGKRGVIAISLPLMILGTLVISVTGSLALFIAGIILIGAGFSVTEATLTAVIGAEFPQKSTLYLGVAQATFSLGAVLSPFACTALFAKGYSYNILFGMVSAAFFALFILFLFARQRNDLKGGTGAGAIYALKFLRKRIFILMAVAMIVYVGAEGAVSFFADSYFEQTLCLPGSSATALSLFWAGMIPTRLFLGAIKLKHRTTIMGCAAGIAVCLIVILVTSCEGLRLGAFCAMGAFYGPCWPLIMDAAAKEYPASVGTVSNLMMSMGGIGGAIMPVIAGALVLGADFRPVFIIAGVCAAVMAVMFYFVGRRPNKA